MKIFRAKCLELAILSIGIGYDLYIEVIFLYFDAVPFFRFAHLLPIRRSDLWAYRILGETRMSEASI